MFRYYPSEYPTNDEVVMIEIKSINQMGADVTLLEYNLIKGMIPLSELTKRRFKSLGKLAKIGKHEAAIVLRVDSEKKHIDLSRRRVSPEEAVSCDDRFQKAKIVHSILSLVSTKTTICVGRLYESLAWPLAKIYGSAFDALQFMGQFPDEVLQHIDYQTIKIARNSLQEIILQKMTLQTTKIRSEIEASSRSYDGFIVIQEACRVTQNLVSALIKGKIEWKITAAPAYVLCVLTFSRCIDHRILTHILDECMVALSSHDGTLRISSALTNEKTLEKFSEQSQ
jgi:translation initiation factor 2 subunit 1